MNRKIKALGLALVAALALTAVMASAASAQFTSTAEHTVLSGSQVESHKFTAGTGIGAINCTNVTLSGTVSGSFNGGTNTYQSPIWELTPTYSSCKDSLGRTVHIAENVSYLFTSGAGKGLFHILGPGNLTITATGSTNCVITITPQNGKNNVSYGQSGKNVLVTTNTNNIHSHISGGFFACGSKITTSSTGTYTGTTLIKGNGEAATISVD